MSFSIRPKDRVLKKLEKFPKAHRKNIEKLVLVLKENPLPYLRFDLVKMKGYKDAYRVRVGKVRIVYTVDFKKRTVEILDADYRGRIY